MCVIKNEADIIANTLQEASLWADKIYVYDNGSTDNTWDIIQSLKSNIIIPWKSDPKPFCESLRGEIFQEFRKNSKHGDWWCRLDSDEYYIKNPRDFLQKVPFYTHVVWGLAIEYYLTQTDLNALDFELPINELLKTIRYYKTQNSEHRFFRYRSRLEWPAGEPWPRHMGAVSKQRIPYKHYKYRSPDQALTRVETRHKAIQNGFDTEAHYWNKAAWNADENHADFMFDDGSGEFDFDFRKIPQHEDSKLRHLFKIFMSITRLWP